MLSRDLACLARALTEAVQDGRVTDELVLAVAHQVAEHSWTAEMLEHRGVLHAPAVMAGAALPADVARLEDWRRRRPVRQAPDGGDAA